MAARVSSRNRWVPLPDAFYSICGFLWRPNIPWKDPKFPLRNPKRFLEGLLDQYLSSIAATHYDTHAVDPELPLLLSAALVSLLRVHLVLADHVEYLGYVPKLVAAVAYEGRRETMTSGEVNNGNHADRTDDPDNDTTEHTRLPKNVCASAVCVSCINLQLVPHVLKQWLQQVLEHLRLFLS